MNRSIFRWVIFYFVAFALLIAWVRNPDDLMSSFSEVQTWLISVPLSAIVSLVYVNSETNKRKRMN